MSYSAGVREGVDLRARARLRARWLRQPRHGERGGPRGLRGAVPEDRGLALQVRGVRLQDEDVQNVQGDEEVAAGRVQVASALPHCKRLIN